MMDRDEYSLKLYEGVYRIYDRLLNSINLPCYRCSQCEKRCRHWVYKIKGLIYCQDCADILAVRLEEHFKQLHA